MNTEKEKENQDEKNCLNCFDLFNPKQDGNSKFCVQCKIILLKFGQRLNFFRMLEEEIKKNESSK